MSNEPQKKIDDLQREAEELTPEQAEAAEGGALVDYFSKQKLSYTVETQPVLTQPTLTDATILTSTDFQKF